MDSGDAYGRVGGGETQMDEKIYRFNTCMVETSPLGGMHEDHGGGCGGYYSVEDAIEGSGFLEGVNIDPKSFV